MTLNHLVICYNDRHTWKTTLRNAIQQCNSQSHYSRNPAENKTAIFMPPQCPHKNILPNRLPSGILSGIMGAVVPIADNLIGVGNEQARTLQLVW